MRLKNWVLSLWTHHLSSTHNASCLTAASYPRLCLKTTCRLADLRLRCGLSRGQRRELGSEASICPQSNCMLQIQTCHLFRKVFPRWEPTVPWQNVFGGGTNLKPQGKVRGPKSACERRHLDQPAVPFCWFLSLCGSQEISRSGSRITPKHIKLSPWVSCFKVKRKPNEQTKKPKTC